MRNLSKYFLWGVPFVLPIGLVTPAAADDVPANSCFDSFSSVQKAERDYEYAVETLLERLTHEAIERKQSRIVFTPRGNSIAIVPVRRAASLRGLLVHDAYVHNVYGARMLKRGVYEIREDGVFHREDGSLTLVIGDNGGTQFHTALGDDMCGDAPDLIMDFCQTFVACAAYDLFCPPELPPSEG